MKKSTMKSLVSYLNDVINMNGGEDASDEIVVLARDEMTAELEKGKAKADANRAVYAEIHDAIIAVLTSATAPVTAQELADETGLSRGKIVYGLTNYWSDEVVKDTTGKSTTYRLA